MCFFESQAHHIFIPNLSGLEGMYLLPEWTPSTEWHQLFIYSNIFYGKVMFTEIIVHSLPNLSLAASLSSTLLISLDFFVVKTYKPQNGFESAEPHSKNRGTLHLTPQDIAIDISCT